MRCGRDFFSLDAQSLIRHRSSPCQAHKLKFGCKIGINNTVNKVQTKKPIILNVEDEETEEIVDVTTPKPTEAPSKTKTKPKGKKKRKKMNW